LQAGDGGRRIWALAGGALKRKFGIRFAALHRLLRGSGVADGSGSISDHCGIVVANADGG